MDKLDELINLTIQFLEERGWNNTKSSDLAKSIVIESAELLEHFQWSESNIEKSKLSNQDLGFEAADILFYLITFCQREGIDIHKAFKEKLAQNAKKYPTTVFDGHHDEEFYRSQKKKYRETKK